MSGILDGCSMAIYFTQINFTKVLAHFNVLNWAVTIKFRCSIVVKVIKNIEITTKKWIWFYSTSHRQERSQNAKALDNSACLSLCSWYSMKSQEALHPLNLGYRWLWANNSMFSVFQTITMVTRIKKMNILFHKTVFSLWYHIPNLPWTGKVLP